MKASINFLKNYIPDLQVDDKDFAERLTMSGTKVESFKKLDSNLEKIFVGKIEKVEKHPDATKLVICTVNVAGKEKECSVAPLKDPYLQIVTGAPNAREGLICPVVVAGGKVAASAHDNEEHKDGIKITAGKLRGVDSQGMCCSIDELGQNPALFARKHETEDGLYEMNGMDVKPGDDALEALGLHDTVFDFEITSNRVDCYSILGIAREVAATYDLKLNKPNFKFKTKLPKEDYINIEVKAGDLCSCFATALVKNLRIKESPKWLKENLRSLGIRPINNIVDITNFVMMELGQPMHAYDYETIKGKKIIVDRATKGEKFKTLDGTERTLDDTMLTIRDSETAIGLAGVMGGENTMITEDAGTLFLEAANFNGTNIRLTSKKVGLRTEASNLFEKGLDPNSAILAINRALALIEELDAGDIVENQITYYPVKKEPTKIEVSAGKINEIIGTNFEFDYMKKVLDKIELETQIKSKGADDAVLEITVPTFRCDINTVNDVAEEITRFYGYNNIKETMPKTIAMASEKNIKIETRNILRTLALAAGYSEARTYSFESEKVYDKLKYSKDAPERNFITIQNPLGPEFAVMRTQLINGMLISLANNYNKRNKNVRLFETASIYLPNKLPLTELPTEQEQIIFGAYGDMDFFKMKGIVEEVFIKLGINRKRKYTPAKTWDEAAPFHPNRSSEIFCGLDKVGMMGEIEPSIADAYEIEERPYIAILNIEKLAEFAKFEKRYKPYAKYPEVLRDISVTVPSNIIASQIEDIITAKAGRILSNLNLFDIYEGKQVKEGFKSMAYSISFVSNDHTLTDAEVDTAMKNIVEALKALGIELRE
jgi:phenylalanyl-tRNA synthetase beta chain